VSAFRIQTKQRDLSISDERAARAPGRNVPAVVPLLREQQSRGGDEPLGRRWLSTAAHALRLGDLWTDG